ncbi:Na+/H+ antiporter NhaC [Suttonella sp. R2A3]|uniref:Na+/H+ antiporter NhaC n=1 Tax=Suttonella sp. R2A3 TaxID=2908648 RepID=UPI001F1ABA23|nr:Na+/H+ antiporter NhaC [Suttonella sp. R2A3]UJF24646.1 Na+/H+ antiporter NhaC [Suttonella sp. R2A3]
MSETQTIRTPSFIHAALTFFAVVLIIGMGLFVLDIGLHSLMLVALLVVGASAWSLYRGAFLPIREAMSSGIARAMSAIYIFILIGVLIAAFIQSGTVATLIYYGLAVISPGWFLPAGLLLCSLMSVATGTSWGTVGTAGVVLIGVGGAMDIPLPIVAGMIVCGACFGDKMSPISDTTNLAAMASQTNLYRHIQSMLYTTGPAYIITLIAFAVVGQQYGANTMPHAELNELFAAIELQYQVSWIALLPLIVLLVLSMARVAPEPSMFFSALVAVVLAIAFQGAEPTRVLNALWSGGHPQTGVESLDGLLSRGGIESMGWTLFLSLQALALGGILHEFGFLRVLITGIISRAKHVGGLVSATILSCWVGNMSMGEAYMSIILGGQLYSNAYDQAEVDRAVLSRSLEEGATLTAPLIPWTTAGAFFATTLGVSVIDYLPYAWMNLLNPLVGIVFAYLGIGLFRRAKG